MPPCLLVNPRSFRASRRGLAGRAMHLVRSAGLEAHEVTNPAMLRSRLERLREQGSGEIWLLAGDGTVLALAQYLAEQAPDWNPALLLLAGGRANVVPRDAGGYPALPALRRALSAWRAGRSLREESIRTLCVQQPGQPVRQGFVWAGALVHEAVRLTAASRARGRGWWRHSLFADPFVLLRWGLRTLLLRVPAPRFDDISARLAGVGELSGSMRVLVAASLEMRDALYDPFARRGAGPVRFTAISADAPRLWRNLSRIVRGRFTDDMDVAHGILSGRGERAELIGINGYALDGELFSCDPALPLVLKAGPTLTVLRPDS